MTKTSEKIVAMIEEANAQYRVLSDPGDESFDARYAESSRAFNVAWRAFTDAEVVTPEITAALRAANAHYDQMQTESKARRERYTTLHSDRASTLRRLKYALFEELGILLDPSETL